MRKLGGRRTMSETGDNSTKKRPDDKNASRNRSGKRGSKEYVGKDSRTARNEQ